MSGVSISAVRDVRHPPGRVYEFLGCLENHRQLGGRRLRVAALDGDGRGGRVVVAGPLGVRRTARTALFEASSGVRTLGGVARVGRTTRARVSWTLQPAVGNGGTRVELEATVCQAGRLDRLLLAVGGRAWLRRAFAGALSELAQALNRPVVEGLAVADDCSGDRWAGRRLVPVPAVTLPTG